MRTNTRRKASESYNGRVYLSSGHIVPVGYFAIRYATEVAIHRNETNEAVGSLPVPYSSKPTQWWRDAAMNLIRKFEHENNRNG